MSLFPSLNGFEPTRQTLHNYAHVMGVIPRTHAVFHPRWWHISLRVTENGLKTAVMDLPTGEAFWLEMDLRHHNVLLQTSYGGTQAFSMAVGLNGTEFGDQILAAVADLGLEGEYAREKFESDDLREYDPIQAENFLLALTSANRIFNEYRATLTGHVGPVQLWPHGFDLSFEWFGTRVESFEEDGEVTEHPSQINLGFYPAGEPYFYSNPWPFEIDKLVNNPLPDGAKWHTEGWQGTMLPYKELVGDDQADARLRAFAKAVYDTASPTLLT